MLLHQNLVLCTPWTLPFERRTRQNTHQGLRELHELHSQLLVIDYNKSDYQHD